MNKLSATELRKLNKTDLLEYTLKLNDEFVDDAEIEQIIQSAEGPITYALAVIAKDYDRRRYDIKWITIQDGIVVDESIAHNAVLRNTAVRETNQEVFRKFFHKGCCNNE